MKIENMELQWEKKVPLNIKNSQDNIYQYIYNNKTNYYIQKMSIIVWMIITTLLDPINSSLHINSEKDEELPVYTIKI